MESLIAGTQELGFELADSHLAAFEVCYRELVDWNRRFNLCRNTALELCRLVCSYYFCKTVCLLFLIAFVCFIAFPCLCSV